MPGVVYLVVCESPLMILAAYVGPRASHTAHTHARTVTGAGVVCVQSLTELPESVADLINEDFEDVDEDTPVVEPR